MGIIDTISITNVNLRGNHTITIVGSEGKFVTIGTIIQKAEVSHKTIYPIVDHYLKESDVDMKHDTYHNFDTILGEVVLAVTLNADYYSEFTGYTRSMKDSPVGTLPDFRDKQGWVLSHKEYKRRITENWEKSRTINPFTGEPIQRVFCPPRPKTYLEIFKAVGCPNAPEDATLQDALEYAEVAFDG